MDENEKGRATAGSIPGRLKHWSEINDSQRIRRLREQVKFLDARLGDLCNVVEKLQQHEHNSSGEVVGLLFPPNWPSGSFRPKRQGTGDDVYF